MHITHITHAHHAHISRAHITHARTQVFHILRMAAVGDKYVVLVPSKRTRPKLVPGVVPMGSRGIAVGALWVPQCILGSVAFAGNTGDAYLGLYRLSRSPSGV